MLRNQGTGLEIKGSVLSLAYAIDYDILIL